MIGNRREQWRVCLRKDRYETELEAQAALDALLASGEALTPERLVKYHCKFCNGWHRGHTKKAKAAYAT